MSNQIKITERTSNTTTQNRATIKTSKRKLSRSGYRRRRRSSSSSSSSSSSNINKRHEL